MRATALPEYRAALPHAALCDGSLARDFDSMQSAQRRGKRLQSDASRSGVRRVAGRAGIVRKAGSLLAAPAMRFGPSSAQPFPYIALAMVSVHAALDHARTIQIGDVANIGDVVPTLRAMASRLPPGLDPWASLCPSRFGAWQRGRGTGAGATWLGQVAFAQ